MPSPSAPLRLLRAACLAGLLAAMPCAGGQVLPLPPAGEHLVGEDRFVTSRHEDTLIDIAKAHGYGYAEIKLANPDVDPWLPGEATAVRLPGRHILPDAPREGIVINIPEMRLYYYPPGKAATVVTYPIGIGKEGWLAPEMVTTISEKVRDPVWYVPGSIREEHAAAGNPLPAMVPPGPNNPLGDFALRLGGSQYLLHGTNRKFGIGMRVSHGCFRLSPEDIRDLFVRVPAGTPVRVVNQPYKAGLSGGVLYLEAYPPLSEHRQEIRKTAMVAAVIEATRHAEYDIDWVKAIIVTTAAEGTPSAIGSARPARRD